MRCLALAALLGSVAATPSLSYPFNNQLPPVAEWGKSFTYTFSQDTFTTTDGQVSYSSSNLPDWLSLNGRTLQGTPQGGSGDQQVHFTLTASDSSGSSEEDCFLQLSNTSPPTYSDSDLAEVLKDSGAVANQNSYVLEPNEGFEIKFPQDFFTSDGRSVVGHYAVQSDHSPLPIWLNFDGGSGTFSGTAPSVNSQIAQAQQYSILYIVSTYEGFESAAANFNLLLGANVLAMNISRDEVNATVGQHFSYEAPMSQVTLNNEPITTANLSSAKASIPDDAQSWLSWDSSKFQLSGSPPEDAAGQNLTVEIEIVDKFNDAVSWDVAINVANKTGNTVFSTSSLPAANATRGKWFEYDLSDYILNKDISLSISGASSWLNAHSSNLSINGMVPRNFESSSVNITATLNKDSNEKSKRASDDTSDSLQARLELYAVGPKVSSSSMSSSRSSSSMSRSSSASRTTSLSHSHSGKSSTRSISATGSNTASASRGSSTSSATPSLGAIGAKNKKSNSTGVAVGCGVGIPVGLLAILAVLLFCFCRRRRRRAAAAAAEGGDFGGGASGIEKRPNSPDGPETTLDESQISAPRPSSKGMTMAPVFRTASSSGSEEFEDALEYPGELGDDRTVYGSPDKYKEAGEDNWDSPQRASTFNFLAMDGNSSQGSLPLHKSTSGDDAATLAPLNPRTSFDFEVPPPREEDDVVGEIPRESWRHTNTGERRWQDARLSNGSLASIVPTEPPTVQMASEEFAPYQPHPPQPTMTREQSSGVLHRIGSQSSSRYSGSTRNSNDNLSSHRISGHYRTESSTESHNSQELSDSSSGGGANFRPYRDENGELHWRQEAVGASSARLNNVGLDRKPSAAKTPNGENGEFVFV